VLSLANTEVAVEVWTAWPAAVEVLITDVSTDEASAETALVAPPRAAEVSLIFAATTEAEIAAALETAELVETCPAAALDELPGVVPDSTAEESKVEFIGPNRMLEKVTLASALALSIINGTPESVAQVPLAAPNPVELVG
jgi:hypothetical protein